MTKLTQKQQDFIEYYCLLNNATKAAIKAGYSKKTARFIGHENLTKLYIQRAIQKEKNKLAEDLEVEKKALVQDLIVLKDQGISESQELVKDRSQQANIAIKAISKIGDFLGFNAPQKLEVNRELESKTDKELDDIIKGDAEI